MCAMKWVVVLLGVCAVAAVVATPSAAHPYMPFAEYVRQFGKTYAIGSPEYAMREQRYLVNMVEAAAEQKRNPLATYGPTEFADYTDGELHSLHSLRLSRRAVEDALQKEFRLSPKDYALTAGKDAELKAMETPATWDWRPKGAVTRVKNQGICGSCWAFSTVGNIEGQWFLAGNNLTSASPQELVSCDLSVFDKGCDGGAPPVAYSWIILLNKGYLASNDEYPYVSAHIAHNAPKCNDTLRDHGNQFHIEWFHLLPHDEEKMAGYVASTGPLSVCVNASKWNHYTGGIMTNCDPSYETDHCVLIVGYDNTHSPPYWIVKNSWGTSWGENGYLRIEKGTDQCLIASIPSTVVVKKK